MHIDIDDIDRDIDDTEIGIYIDRCDYKYGNMHIY